MARFLLDTNHLSPLVTPAHPLQTQFLQRYRGGDAFGVAVPALTELLFGIRTLPRA